MAFALKVALFAMTVCGLAAAASHGVIYGDVGNDAPFLQTLEPPQGPKAGGTAITIKGMGFQNDVRAQCRFARLNPDTEQTVVKTTAVEFKSSTEVVCPSPAWEETSCATCAATKRLTGDISGHTGSRYLRVANIAVLKEIGVGDYIQLAGATVGNIAGKNSLTQYYKIEAIQQCSGTGCVCNGGTWAESTYTVAKTFNGTGTYYSAANSGHEVITATDTNCAMYRYDELTGGAGHGDSSLPVDAWHSRRGEVCTPVCTGGAWAAGAKIKLAEPVYKINGRKNVAFTGKIGYRASKFSCTSCKCAEGCKVTVSVTNDGQLWSGSGVGGFAWAGSALAFSLKDIVPTVKYIDNGMPGYRDSTRIFGPASGGTTLTVIGENFQQSPQLRCYFAGVRTMVKAEWVSSEKVLCKTPEFFSRQLDGTMVQSNQDGSASNPHTKVHVTNTGMLGDPVAEGETHGHLSMNPYIMDDNSKAYIHTFAAGNTWNNGLESGNPWRSTCQAGLYPNENMKPCWDSHIVSAGGAAVDSATGGGKSSEGNDVLFKYATCYDSQPAAAAPSLDLYSGTDLGGKFINSTTSLGQVIKLTDQNYPNNHEKTGNTLNVNNVEGPLSYIELHLQKDTDAQAVLEVSVGAGGFPAHHATPGTTISKETIVVSKISAEANYKYKVYFNTPAYLKTGTNYYLQIKYVSGAQDTQWKYTNGGTGGFYAHLQEHGIYGRFKVKGYTCDGCRTKYAFDPATPLTNRKFGETPTTQENGGSTYLTQGTYRSMLAQEFRPSETGSLTHAYLKLKSVTQNGVDKAYASVWITQHGKYGEYVCTSFGGHPSTLLNKCDTNMTGHFVQACALGSVCDPNAALNGGCGDRGVCGLAQTVTHAHRLRPESGGPDSPCGPSETCAMTMTLTPDHQKTLTGIDKWVEFEFKTPVPVEKHTTYFVNVAVVGNTDVSKEVIWYSGAALGDGRYSLAHTGDTNKPADELRASFTRDKTTWRWVKNPNTVQALKFRRCVTSTANVMGFSVSGEKTGCCSARASPQGGDKGAEVIITGRNFFPSDHLKCVFRNENGMGGMVVPGKVLDASYTKMSCKAPTHNPHSSRDCTNQALCKGVELLVTNDGFTTGPQYMGPKWKDPVSTSAIPAYLGQNPLKFLFSDIHVSPTGSDVTGDGTVGRPYATIQRAVDAANEYDQVVLMSGTYVGLGNRGLRHHGKRIQLKSYNLCSTDSAGTTCATDGDRQSVIIDCQHAPDGFILNNNKDSESPHAGWIDTQDIITRNCENLRIYDI